MSRVRSPGSHRRSGRQARSPVPVATTAGRPGEQRPRPRRSGAVVRTVVLLAAVGAAVAVITGGNGVLRGAAGAGEVTPTPSPTVVIPPPPAASPSPSPTEVTPSPEAPALEQPGPVPSRGTGRFGYDDQVGPVLGTAGTLRRYRVAVESGSGADAGEFALAVRTALAGPGSWVDSGRLRLRQVEATSRYDFTVYLATAATAGQMCAAGGVDIRVGGRPYTSCRTSGKVIINLDRWRLSVPHFVEAGVPLSVYRTYVINHEVGHQLGNRHERCPRQGEPAPVMMQQTLFLKGCVANPWPYLDGRRYAGPSL
ncbi:hypothetical protein C1I95_26935 [Micromonospora craterilacus]|uniref:DUF3152 domain-containing protein n=1 Tax=Micromonospora craterilacus TaxID=1655439 RepID=A0A2W2F7Y8_9ACTN|nr:DUF3152 domain-containing protein [Micromonospora craterilacus]PZG11764.1 hypothetical protein C1I95_26935 [Micromonospora craterilacus]